MENLYFTTNKKKVGHKSGAQNGWNYSGDTKYDSILDSNMSSQIQYERPKSRSMCAYIRENS